MRCLYCDIETKNKKYCSKKCADLDKVGKPSKKKDGDDVKCGYCDNVFYKRKNSVQKFCSSSCWGKGVQSKKRPERKTGSLKNCFVCNEEFYVPRVRKDSAKFCSVNCANVFQRSQVKKIIKKCRECGSKFEVFPSREKQSKERGWTIKFCSIKCRDKSDETKAIFVKINDRKNKNQKRTTLELLGREILKRLCVEFEEQYLVDNLFNIDVFLINYNIAIEWDGDYWHGHESKLKDGIPDKRQRIRIDKDIKRNSYMSDLGITVLRFWEHEVHKNKGDDVYEIIKTAIQKAT